jgi:hypothetical protein
MEQSYYWLTIASNAGHAAAPGYRSDIGKQLSAAKREQLDKAAASFQPKDG